MSKKEDGRLQGLCKECTHRNSCKDAKRHLNVINCSKYKHWKRRQDENVKSIMENHQNNNWQNVH